MPASSSPDLLSRDDRALCDAVIFSGSKSFDAASRLLPRDVRIASRALYAFCRASDDLVDEERRGRAAILQLRGRVAAIYAEAPLAQPCDRAFAAVVRRYRLPRALPDALIEGFEWDEAGRDYRTVEDLLDYCARVASTVGVMMALIMGCTDRHGFARAADLGLAMQLTNIARDIGEDARRGRIYLPLDWLREAGISRGDLLRAEAADPALRALTARLLALAAAYYRRALTGLAALPLACRPAIRSAALIYREIGQVIARNGHDSVSRRARTTTARKLALLARAAATPVCLADTDTAPPEAATAFLVGAAVDATRWRVQEAQGFGRFLELMLTAEARQYQTGPALRERA